MREVRPSAALADERDLGLDLIAICASISVDDADDLAPVSSDSVGPAVAEDPRIAVLVGADRARRCRVSASRLGEDVSGARIAGVLEVVLDALEPVAPLGMLDLEARDDERPLARRRRATNAIGRSVGMNAKPV